MNTKKMLQDIEAICRTKLEFMESDLHGIGHLRAVCLLAGRLAEESGADVESAMVGGFLHDCGRMDDQSGSQHAIDSAQLARLVLDECFPHLDAESICDAIARHADGEITDDPVAGAIWDADRLLLGRLGFIVQETFFSTLAAKKILKDQASAS